MLYRMTDRLYETLLESNTSLRVLQDIYIILFGYITTRPSLSTFNRLCMVKFVAHLATRCPTSITMLAHDVANT
ncbi:hypothetical protein M0802_003974 [Mischocyttarus mexicanus]|nr:hypothetical protein M0802_003974 [Mischocyttarus mexicanus]